MAITIDDFSNIWASTSPLTPYEFSESTYKEGWNFIGGTPPSRQMWDFLQKNNDEKSQFLLNNFNNYLPLSGGTFTGTVNGVTPPVGDNSTKMSTTEYVQTEISAINTRLGTVLTASGSSTVTSSFADICSISTHKAGVWLIVSYLELSYSENTVYNNTISTQSHGDTNTRNTGLAGGGSNAVMITALDENEVVTLQGYKPSAGTMSGNLKMVRLA